VEDDFFSPLELDELELLVPDDEVAELELPELADLLDAEPDVLPVLPVLPVLADVLFWLCVAVAADAAPGRAEAMPPPASTLAAPMATVTARSRPWPRWRAATADRTG
jgi:hypothetical protein